MVRNVVWVALAALVGGPLVHSTSTAAQPAAPAAVPAAVPVAAQASSSPTRAADRFVQAFGRSDAAQIRAQAIPAAARIAIAHLDFASPHWARQSSTSDGAITTASYFDPAEREMIVLVDDGLVDAGATRVVIGVAFHDLRLAGSAPRYADMFVRAFGRADLVAVAQLASAAARQHAAASTGFVAKTWDRISCDEDAGTTQCLYRDRSGRSMVVGVVTASAEAGRRNGVTEVWFFAA